MVSVKPIHTEADYDAAVARIGGLMDSVPGTPEGEELDLLADLVILYESRHIEKELPSPTAAIEFRMEQAGMMPRDLVPFIGSRAKVSEVLSGKRDITMSMARALHKHLGISADVLLNEKGATLDPTFDSVDPRRFPLREMAKRSWIPDIPSLQEKAEELIAGLVERAGGRQATPTFLFRKTDHRRLNAKTDQYALAAWLLQLMALANSRPADAAYEPGTVTPDFLRQVAELSAAEDGPRQARDFLVHHGITIEFLSHLPRTYLDGAALRLENGRPVIGLTLRYDRVDNFWFCLLHELSHIGLHLDEGEDDAFVDDLTLREVEGAGENTKETQADEWAEEALIPKAVWDASGILSGPSAMSVLNLAYEASVHPAIVAGRIRHETGNYRLLSQFVGNGQIRRQLEPIG